MRKLLPALMVLCGVATAGFGQDGSQDPYSEKLVTVLASGNSPVVSMQEKAVNRLGDAAAVGLIRHLGSQLPSTSQEIKGIVFVIRMAFAAPEVINSDANREPKATLLLFEYLNYLPASKDLRAEIGQARVFVLHQLDAYKHKNPSQSN